MIELSKYFEDAVIDFKMDQALIFAEKLKKSGDKTEYDSLQIDSLLQEMIAWNRMDAVELLLNVGVNPNGKDNGETPLNVAVLMLDEYWNKDVLQEQIIDFIKVLLSFWADFELQGSNGWPPLFWAICRNLKTVTLFLLEQGADPNQMSTLDEDYPIEVALFHKSAEIGLLLLDYGADPFVIGKRLAEDSYLQRNLLGDLERRYKVTSLEEVRKYFLAIINSRDK